MRVRQHALRYLRLQRLRLAPLRARARRSLPQVLAFGASGTGAEPSFQPVLLQRGTRTQLLGPKEAARERSHARSSANSSTAGAASHKLSTVEDGGPADRSPGPNGLNMGVGYFSVLVPATKGKKGVPLHRDPNEPLQPCLSSKQRVWAHLNQCQCYPCLAVHSPAN